MNAAAHPLAGPALPDTLVFVDLETTGATATADRITEVGIVTVRREAEGCAVSHWSQLVNPQTRIPDFIVGLTGISNEMVADAPRFEDIATDLRARLGDAMFVAHNARFDYGFLRNEFARVGIDFRARVLCTVKLSRLLEPQHRRHSLDALIARHGLTASGRHRALADADLIWQFWQRMAAGIGMARLADAVAELSGGPALPPHIDAAQVADIPEGPGVYLFYGDNALPLYIGKSRHLRKRVLSHFAADHRSGKEMSLSMQVRRIDWIETEGEIGALLKEASLVKRMLPTHNRQLRRTKSLCSWRLPDASLDAPALVWAADIDPGRQDDLYGLFASQRDALKAMTRIADEHGLCRAVLGLEKVQDGAPCFAFQLKQCGGACTGRESRRAHHARLLLALQNLKVAAWPYRGPVGLREGRELHVIDGWRHLGTARDEAQLADILAGGQPEFDLDVYRILLKGIRTAEVVPLHA